MRNVASIYRYIGGKSFSIYCVTSSSTFNINMQSNCAERTRISGNQSPSSTLIPLISLHKFCCAIIRHPKFGLETRNYNLVDSILFNL